MARTLSRRTLAAYVAAGVHSDNRTQVLDQLAAYLLETGRTKESDLILRDIQVRLSEIGYVNATVTSGYDVDTATLDQIERYITQKTDAHTVHTTVTINPKVGAGLKISIPGAELDRTAARSLHDLRTRFKTTRGATS